MKILDESLIKNTISMEEAIDVLRENYRSYSSSSDNNPARTIVRVQEKHATFGVMPYYSHAHNLFMVKIVSHHLLNKAYGRPSIGGVIVIQDGATGQIKAQMDAAAITALRTGATAGLATDLLAMAHSKKVAVIGAGAQAMAVFEAVLSVRKVKQVAVCSTSQTSTERFIADAKNRFVREIEYISHHSVRQAVSGADIICTATTCAAPLFSACDVAKGAHINAIGKHTLVSREFPLELLHRAILMVEDRKAAIEEAGDYHQNSISIAQMLNSQYAVHQRETTIFSSVGTAFQDACICIAILKKLKVVSGGS